jgi:hypothetical protein
MRRTRTRASDRKEGVGDSSPPECERRRLLAVDSAAPAYAATDLQTEIAEASSVCHGATSTGDESGLGEAGSALDVLVAQLWGVSEADLLRAQQSLKA